MSEKIQIQLNDVPETLLITLYSRAIESQRPDALFIDEKAVSVVNRINYDFSRIKLQSHDQVAIIFRLKTFDRMAQSFLQRYPDSVVIHIGCGLDTRFERIDNGRVIWYDLDLPEVISLRKLLFTDENARNKMVAGSVFSDAWIDLVKQHGHRSYLFLAEGVFPYFMEDQLKHLFARLEQHFPGCEIVFDAARPFLVWADNLHLLFAGLKARLHWGLNHAADLENWSAAYKLLEDWYYFDQSEPRLGNIQWLLRLPFLKKASGVFQYQLGRSD